jgi:hypothetical protein
VLNPTWKEKKRKMEWLKKHECYLQRKQNNNMINYTCYVHNWKSYSYILPWTALGLS